MLAPFPNIDVLIARVPGAELRLVGNCLPFLPAVVEHCILCVACSGTARGPTECFGCYDAEAGGSTGYTSRNVCIEGDCAACDRFDDVCQPGRGQQVRYLGCNYEDREGRCDANDGEPCAFCEKRREDEAAYWRRESRTVTLAEGDPERYRREMVEAGRGGLLP